ncbi:MAG: hypothetical protein WBG86_20355 [Polyangiales bacterium]
MARMKSKGGWIALVVALWTANAGAEGDPLGVDGVAEAIVLMTTPVWTGPRTPPPPDTPRPKGASRSIRSAVALVAVHVPPDTDEATGDAILRALEFARAELDVLGWPAPLPDGSLGGGPELDLYLAPRVSLTQAFTDDLATWSFLDRASAFAVMSPETPTAAIPACVTAAYAEALLLSMDPAEAPAWRRATAAWLTWEITGRFGCEDAVFEQQAEPYRSWVRGAAAKGAGGAMLLAFLSARHDDSRSEFVRDAWLLASQRTWEGRGLRADPDLWSAIQTAIERSGDRLLANIEELAIQRWFVGRGRAKSDVIAAIDSDARVPITRSLTRVPTRTVAPRPLESFGSAYLLLPAGTWAGATQLRAWLEGEYGVRWSFVAVQLDGNGSEIRRVASPTTEATPQAYLPIDLDEATESLLLVVTNLSSRLPDADMPDANQRAFQVTLDRADEP